MNLLLTKDEAMLLAHACNEMFRKHADLAAGGKREGSEWAAANEQNARKFRELGDRIIAIEQGARGKQ